MIQGDGGIEGLFETDVLEGTTLRVGASRTPDGTVDTAEGQISDRRYESYRRLLRSTQSASSS